MDKRTLGHGKTDLNCENERKHLKRIFWLLLKGAVGGFMLACTIFVIYALIYGAAISCDWL